MKKIAPVEVDSPRKLREQHQACREQGLGTKNGKGDDACTNDALQGLYCPNKKRIMSPPRVVVIGKAFDT